MRHIIYEGWSKSNWNSKLLVFITLFYFPLRKLSLCPNTSILYYVFVLDFPAKGIMIFESDNNYFFTLILLWTLSPINDTVFDSFFINVQYGKINAATLKMYKNLFSRTLLFVYKLSSYYQQQHNFLLSKQKTKCIHLERLRKIMRTSVR